MASGCAQPQSSLLFTQKAPNATIEAVSSDLTSVVITLHGVGHTTTFFSNTPDRYAGRLPTETFAAVWRDNDTAWRPNAALTGIGSLGKERTIIVTLNEAPVYDAANHTLTYNASVILQNTTLDGSEEMKSTASVVNNMARGLQAFLLTQKDVGAGLDSITLTHADLFIDNVAGCVGWNGIWVHTGVCGRSGGWYGGGGVCAGYRGVWVGGVWCE